MPDFTTPNGDPLHEVNHCHGPGPGHPCTGPGDGGGRSESELERERQRHAAEDTRAKMERSRHEREENLTVGDVARHEQMAKGRYTVTFRDGKARQFNTLNGAMRAKRPGAVVTSVATGKQIGPTNAQKMKDRAAGMRRQRLAAGGWSAEKQRKRDFQMAKGRQTQKMVRAIRKREE